MRKIIWAKWEDPLKAVIDLHERESPEETDAKYPLGPFIVGPGGVIPVREGNLPSVIYDMWMGHTNFDIDKAFLEKVCVIPGVEAINVFTRYRFRLAVGRAFDNAKVRLAIQAVTCPKKKTARDFLKSSLRGYPAWAIYRDSEGRINAATGLTKKEVVSKLTKEVLTLDTSWRLREVAH